MAPEDERDIGILIGEVRALKDVVARLEASVSSLHGKHEDRERRANDACKSCSTWPRITALEIAVAEGRGVARGWALGASAVASALTFLAAWFVLKGGR